MAELKVELGGGDKPRGGGYLNVDRCAGADVVCDLEREPLPFADGSVDALYSSHCLEHVANVAGVLREVARVCREGAAVEFRLPHWLHPMAMCPGHVHVLSDEQVRRWAELPEIFFAGCPRRLRLLGVEYVPDARLEEARGLFPGLADEALMRFLPGCCHEVRYRLEVVANGGGGACA